MKSSNNAKEVDSIGTPIREVFTELKALNSLHQQWTERWHLNPTRTEQSPLWGDVEANHFHNFSLWHEEDVARRDDISAERIRDAKRNIDRFNQARNDAMEKIDHSFFELFPTGFDLDVNRILHSETPGMMIDRLSIMALKHYHMTEQARRTDADFEHRRKCAFRAEVLQEQQHDLTTALDLLLADLGAGRKRFKVYRQFKMYNDPTLNPQLYGRDPV